MHYRFAIPFSRYYKDEPEILSDIPHRINPNKHVPVMILVKDADKYPIDLRDINIEIYQNSQLISSSIYMINEKINCYWWHKTLKINTKETIGHTNFVVYIKYKVYDKIKIITNHNLDTLKPIPFDVYLSKSELPGNQIAQYGDIHYHSHLTDDMVEFGAPLKPTLEACSVLGLDFICNTDHSYDLDDKYGTWFENDPELKKWNDSRKEINHLNQHFKFSPFLIPSEELSMHNSNGENIHALILNNSKFLPGQGDSAEKPFDFSCEFNSSNLHSNLEENSLCIASHPYCKVSFLERLFFKRGNWKDSDVLEDNMIGLQILNGEFDYGFYKGKKKWISYILNGNKKFIFAGNDAHGNFNKFRQISIPMFKIKESSNQILGVCKTGVFPKEKNNISSTIKAMKMGNCFITNGPFLNLNFISKNKTYSLGASVEKSKGKLKITALSNDEFGHINRIKLIKGEIDKKEEEIMHDEIIENEQYEFYNYYEININTNCYFRAETESMNYRGKCIAMTNPIWFTP